MQPFSFFAFIPDGAPEGADDIAKALCIASIVKAMHDVPATTRPEVHLAAHLAKLTDSHIIFLPRAADAHTIPHGATPSAAVHYGKIHLGHLYCVGVPDAAIVAVCAFITQLAAVCASMLVVQHCSAVLREADEAEMATLPRRLAYLTAKEGKTLHHLAHGKGAEAIATTQKIGLGTVRTYLKNIYAKLEVKGQVQATYTGVLAQMLGLLS